jgi:hypothetical protein
MMVRKTYAMDEDSLRRIGDLSRWWGGKSTVSFSAVLRVSVLKAWLEERERLDDQGALADALEPPESKRR